MLFFHTKLRCVKTTKLWADLLSVSDSRQSPGCTNNSGTQNGAQNRGNKNVLYSTVPGKKRLPHMRVFFLAQPLGWCFVLCFVLCYLRVNFLWSNSWCWQCKVNIQQNQWSKRKLHDRFPFGLELSRDFPSCRLIVENCAHVFCILFWTVST